MAVPAPGLMVGEVPFPLTQRDPLCNVGKNSLDLSGLILMTHIWHPPPAPPGMHLDLAHTLCPTQLVKNRTYPLLSSNFSLFCLFILRAF